MQIVFFVAAFLLCVLRGISVTDETWFFQVVCRMDQGEVLYRDIFFGVTPISAHLARFFVWLFGEQLIVAKALMAFVFALVVHVTQKIGRKMGIQQGIFLFLPLALFTFSEKNMILSGSLYNLLANLFFLTSFLFALQEKWGRAALLAALCFCTKQTFGLWAFVSLASGAICLGKKRELYSIGAIFILTLCSLAVFLYLSDGLQSFIEYGIVNKKSYLIHGKISYFFSENYRCYLAPLFFLPFVAYLSLLYVKTVRKEWILLFLFLTADLLNVYPRADRDHMSIPLPLELIAILLSWRGVQEALVSKVFSRLLCVAMALLLFAFYIQPFVKGATVLSSLPHFRGIVVSAEFEQKMEDKMRRILAAENGAKIVFMNQDASIYYLATGLSNPLPYDCPSPTSMGLYGQRELASQFAQKEVRIFIEDQEVPWNSYPEAKLWVERRFD